MNTVLDPFMISFSQLFISNSGTWDKSLYKAIDVVRFESQTGEFSYVSLDNRRLYIAQIANIPSLQVKVHNDTQRLNYAMSKRFKLSVAFEIESNQCITIDLYPLTFASAVFGRCSLQSSAFNIYGSKDQPTIDTRRSTHHWPETPLRMIQKRFIKSDNETNNVFRKLRESEEIVCYIGDNAVPIIHNLQFQELIKSVDIQTLYDYGDIVLYSDYMFFKARGPDSDADYDEESEREIDKLLCDREREIIRSRDEAYYAAITSIELCE